MNISCKDGHSKRQKWKKKDRNVLNDPDNHDSVITHLEPDILKCKVKWALGSITMNKASGGDGFPPVLFQILKDDAVRVLHSIYQQIWKTALATGLNRSVFIPVPKKGNAKECSNYHTIPLISHACKVVFKVLQARLQHYMNWELPDVQTGFRNGRGTRDQIANICGSSKKQENIRKTSTTALLIMPKPLTLWITTNCGKLFKRWDYQTTLTCLLRNLYAGQEATVRTGHGTTDLFQIGKGICQGCILSPCLFNLYAEYSKQAGIKIAGRNINNLRYTDDTILWHKVKEN